MEGIPQTATQVAENVEAPSFDEAVRKYVSSLSSDNRSIWTRQDDGTWTYWGCRAFDNERDARKGFG